MLDPVEEGPREARDLFELRDGIKAALLAELQLLGFLERSLTRWTGNRDSPVWMRHGLIATLGTLSKGGEMGAIQELRRRVRIAGPDRGQGTVEYVGLILLVSLLMVGMVAAMKGFNGGEGTELAEVIVGKIKSAVNAITFR